MCLLREYVCVCEVLFDCVIECKRESGCQRNNTSVKVRGLVARDSKTPVIAG